jgi:hypothetical protein
MGDRAVSEESDSVAPPPLHSWPLVSLIVGVVVVLGIVVAFVDLLGAYGQCGVENNGCAAAGPPRLWLGRVFTRNGAPAASATVRYYFASVSSLSVVPFTLVTDREGRYCLRWPNESQSPYVLVVARAAAGAPDPRFVALARQAGGPLVISPDGGELDSSGFIVWHNAPGTGGITDTGWNAAADTTKHCESGLPPWYSINPVTGNWHFKLLLWAVLAAIVLAIVAVIGRAFKRRAAWPVLLSSLGTATASTILLILIWGTHTI